MQMFFQTHPVVSGNLNMMVTCVAPRVLSVQGTLDLKQPGLKG